MTALDKYVRLESGGLWRADADAQRREVTVSFGDATLVIADGAGRPLAHWSLPALERHNPDTRPAIYAPDEDGDETVEIADDLMIDAIEEVRKALARARPKPGKLRHWITAITVLVALALAVFWLPGALTRQTLAVVPHAKRAEIGAAILAHIQTQTGAACSEPRALDAARQLAARLWGDQTLNQIVVVPYLDQGAVAIPGGIIVLGYSVLQASDDPAVAAGFILAAHAVSLKMDPLEDLLRRAGLGTTFRLLTTGDIPDDILRMDAKAIVAGTRVSVESEMLSDIFAASKVPIAPHIVVAQAGGGGTFATGSDPAVTAAIPVILDDTDWVSLRNICNV